MINLRTFKRIYLQLQDIESQSIAIHSVLEHMPCSLDFFLQALEGEKDLTVKNDLIAVYNNLIQDRNPAVIQLFLRKDYVSLQTLFGLLSAYVFNQSPFETIHHLDVYTNQLIKRLNKKTTENGNPEDILAEIHHKITQSLILDDSYLGHYNFSEVPHQHIISQYTLGILILIIAEKLSLPLFGLPFEDKIVLCYAENYCTHSELVTEEDILYYLVIGEKDIIYTLEDLKLLAIIQEENLELKTILPKSTQKIIENWMNHVCQRDFDSKTKYNLSSIYQQIFSLAEEF